MLSKHCVCMNILHSVCALVSLYLRNLTKNEVKYNCIYIDNLYLCPASKLVKCYCCIICGLCI